MKARQWRGWAVIINCGELYVEGDGTNDDRFYIYATKPERWSSMSPSDKPIRVTITEDLPRRKGRKSE